MNFEIQSERFKKFLVKERLDKSTLYFGDPSKLTEIEILQNALGVVLPEEVKSLLIKNNGIYSDNNGFAIPILASTGEILTYLDGTYDDCEPQVRFYDLEEMQKETGNVIPLALEPDGPNWLIYRYVESDDFEAGYYDFSESDKKFYYVGDSMENYLRKSGLECIYE